MAGKGGSSEVIDEETGEHLESLRYRYKILLLGLPAMLRIVFIGILLLIIAIILPIIALSDDHYSFWLFLLVIPCVGYFVYGAIRHVPILIRMYKFYMFTFVPCSHCLRNIFIPRLKYSCPFCDKEYVGTYYSLFFKCRNCGKEMPCFDCPKCGNQIDLINRHPWEEIERKRYGG